MKRQLLSIAVAAGTVLAAAMDVHALPPLRHSVNGVVEEINCASRTITIKSKDGAPPLTFVWNDRTRFLRRGGCAKCGIVPGQTVHAWYRREFGQNVLREVTTNRTSVERNVMCQ